MCKLKWTNDIIKKYINENSDYEIIEMGENHGLTTRIKIKCNKGHVYDVSFSKFKQGRRCSKCVGNKKYEYNEVKEFIENQGYQLISEEYNNCFDKLSIICPEGHACEMSFVNFRRGERCSKCVGNKKYEYNEVKEFIENQGYQLISEEYNNCKEKLKLICPNNHEYYVSFDNFKRGRRCSHCIKRSKGEERISDFLSNHNILYEREYVFKQCKYKHVIPFDFYLPEYNMIIEYDGIQHFEEIEIWGGKEALKLTQLKDDIKDKFCISNGIQMLRISYWEFDDIELLLNHALNLNLYE